MKTLLFLILLLGVSFAQLDGPCSAQYIPGPYNHTIVKGSNFNTTNSPSGAANCYYSSSRIAWYTISTTQSTTVEISTCNPGTDFDTILFLATGSNCSAISCLSSSDDTSCSIAFDASEIIYPISPGNLYYIGVGGYSTNTGDFTLTIQDQMYEDTCDNAKAVPGPYYPPIQILANNQNSESAYYPCSGNLQKPVWFTIYPSSQLPMTIDTCNTSTTVDTTISIYEGTCSSLVCEYYSDDDCDGDSTSITFIPTLSSYLVAVAGYGSEVGNLAIRFSQALASSCSNPLPIAAGASSTQQIVGQPSISGDACGVLNGEPGFWFILENLSSSAPAVVTTCSSNTNFDTVIAVYSGSCSALHCVGSNDDTTCVVTGQTITSQVTFTPAPSTTYYAVVSAYGNARGTFVLTVKQ